MTDPQPHKHPAQAHSQIHTHTLASSLPPELSPLFITPLLPSTLCCFPSRSVSVLSLSLFHLSLSTAFLPLPLLRSHLFILPFIHLLLFLIQSLIIFLHPSPSPFPIHHFSSPPIARLYRSPCQLSFPQPSRSIFLSFPRFAFFHPLLLYFSDTPFLCPLVPFSLPPCLVPSTALASNPFLETSPSK